MLGGSGRGQGRLCLAKATPPVYQAVQQQLQQLLLSVNLESKNGEHALSHGTGRTPQSCGRPLVVDHSTGSVIGSGDSSPVVGDVHVANLFV